VKNITVSVPDDVYRAARVRAAHDGRSVSSLVAEFLSSLSRRDEEFKALVAEQERLLDEIQASGRAFSASDRLSRDEIHDRDALR
jgi:plasmid stability protein